MRVIIRTDASSAIGSGHVMRCVTLADALKERGATTSFICRDLPGHLGSFIEQRGYPVCLLSADRADEASFAASGDEASCSDLNWEFDLRQTQECIAVEDEIDWLIVDHYNLDERWEQAMRPRVAHILAIDDLADRLHDCDLLLDQNYHHDSGTRYDRLVPDHCRRLLGPEFALLRPEFTAAREHMRARNGTVERMLIFLGGADPHNTTEKAVNALRNIHRLDIAADIVIGAVNPHAERLKTVCRLMPNCTYHHRVDTMSTLMAAADLAIGAPGSSTWERCCLGLPTIFIATARNEVHLGQAAEAVGIGSYLGMHYDVTPSTIANEMRALLANPVTVKTWSDTAATLVDGTGVERVCRAVCEYHEAEVAR